MIKIKAVIYSRISTSDLYQNIKQQRDYCRDYAKRNGYEVLHVFNDKCSGNVPMALRSGSKRLLRFLKDNSDVYLIVQDLNRLSRCFVDSVAFMNFLMKYKINLISLSQSVDLSTPNGRLMFRINISLNSYYTEDLHEKIRIGIKRAQKEGLYCGRKPGSKNKVKNK